MPDKIVDLRSDTVTTPTPEMRRAIFEAEVGDDVIDVDPTVEHLQKRIAARLGKEAAIYMPSGTRANQIALRVHCRPGDEFICEADCHVYNYEQGAFAQLSGIVAHTLQGEFGVLQPEQLIGSIRPADDHMVRTRLITLENTHNRGAGRVQPYDTVVEICRWARDHGLRTHLDGARLFNAAVASGIDAQTWAQHFDTVSVCFSKGLGAPIGSALCGPRGLIREARRHRKLFGGGMRQAGIIAAGALYALEHHVDRLAEDHEHAQILASAVHDAESLELTPAKVDTNIVIFQLDRRLGSAADFVARLREEGVLMLPVAHDKIRAVTHLDVNHADMCRSAEVVRRLAANHSH
jgi:threonine aldolase